MRYADFIIKLTIILAAAILAEIAVLHAIGVLCLT